MINYNILALVIGINVLTYLIIHIPLDILTLASKVQREKNNAENYPAWEKDKAFIKIITLITSLLFWIFFLVWPLLHLLKWDNFFLYFNFEIPYLITALQYIGLIFVCLGTFIACLGRISRSIYAISWGVPNQLTTRLGYRIVRHPLYTSYCCYFLGVPLAMQNYLLLILVLGIIGYVQTARYEEKILLQEFGEEYEAFQRKVGMIIPFIGRRK